MLLFDVAPRSVSWCFLNGARRLEGKAAALDEVFPAIERQLGTLRDTGPAGYVLRHGGETIRQPVSLVSAETIISIQACSRFLPADAEALSRMLSLSLSVLPDVPHLLFCDTAFFVDLPEYVCHYAIPMSINEPSLRRYGGFGLCHQWVWDSLQLLSPVAPSRVVSVYCGEQTNIAAIRDGKALETTIGFTPVEGVSSAHSCGDIDPTIVFQVRAAGLAFSEISRLLAEQSGFSGLLGRECTIREIVQDATGDPGLAKVREFYKYQIKKYIGAFVSVLGGVDAVALVTEGMTSFGGFIRSFIGELDFLTIHPAPGQAPASRLEPAPASAPAPRATGPEPAFRLTQEDSPVQVYGLAYDKWKNLYENGLSFVASSSINSSGKGLCQ